ncbi:unnamed protein product [Fraxinus pennsylvanica]|uniref:Uncharacterized protein n=1 Tax=Fraxinus pennsylvanica TaxID=56036 RepID=A0AAD1YYG1_9LAMI|nr:unnamed protein product [Fraxinus pennsylvanica]
MSMTCQNLEFGRTRLGFVVNVCSFNVYLDRISVINRVNDMLMNVSGGYKGKKLWSSQTKIGPCHVFSTNTTQALLNGVAVDHPPTNFFEVVAEDIQMMNKNLQSMVGEENPILMSSAEHIFGAGGKRMRPSLVFLVSRATTEIVGLKELTKEHRQLAEVIEMIHTASLIHDDVLDESDMRRGKETLHQLYGTRVAVLAGDFIFAQSLQYLANLENFEVIKLIGQVIKDFASGEMTQASSLFDCDVQLDEYLMKSHYKTASLIAASTKGAAIFSGVDSEISDQMYQFGSDLVKGNLTAPVIFALKKEPKLRDIIKSDFCELGSLDEAIDIIKSCGGIDKARELAKLKADLALENLQCLPSTTFRYTLEEMVKYNLERIK